MLREAQGEAKCSSHFSSVLEIPGLATCVHVYNSTMHEGQVYNMYVLYKMFRKLHVPKLISRGHQAFSQMGV